MLFEQETIDRMKEDLYYLIRRYCKSYRISNFQQELFLHDSTRIEYTTLSMAELDRFVSLVHKYWDYFANLSSNLSCYDEMTSIELSDRVVGVLDVGKTIRVRGNHSSQNVVCSINIKNIYSPENVMLAVILLGINILAAKFLREVNENLLVLANYTGLLLKIIEYSGLLLKNRLIARLSEHYILNYKNLESLAAETYNEIIQGKFKEKYTPLLIFIRDWIRYEYIINKPTKSLFSALTAYLDNLDNDTIYEIWIFYKILKLLEPVTQSKIHGHKLFMNDLNGISIQYQAQEEINWILEERMGNPHVIRRPDVLIRKNGHVKALIDAKCMPYRISHEENELPSPDRDIVNQMIIYLDHIGPSDLGIVLFADSESREDVIIRQGNRRIMFLNCYPYKENSNITLEKIQHCIL